MKKLLFNIALAFMLIGMALLPYKKVSAESIEFQDLNINETEDIQYISGGDNFITDKVTTRQNSDFGTESFYYKFNLTDNAYIKISNYAQIFEHNFNGKVKVYLSTSSRFTNPVIDQFGDDQEEVFSTLLDKGTYYIKVDASFTDNSAGENSSGYRTDPQNTISVFAEYIMNSAKETGISKKSAVNMKCGERSQAEVTYFSRAKYLKFDVSHKSDVIFLCNSKTKEGWDEKTITTPNGILWSIYNENGDKLAFCQTNESYAYGEEKAAGNYKVFHLNNLEAGTYYVAASCGKETPKSERGVFEANCTPIILKAPVIKAIKSSNKKSMKVELKAKISAVNGYEIQYAASKDMKNAKTVTIGKNTTLTATIKKLQSGKKYYVQVRSYYRDADDNVYYGGWSKMASVEIKK